MYHWYIKINEAYKLNHIINIEAVYPSDTRHDSSAYS